MSQLNLSARGYHRVLKLARTVADLAGSDQIQSEHLAEALYLRQAKADDGTVRQPQCPDVDCVTDNIPLPFCH
jgi:hypothetical protein